ncbi:unnamed protein product [Pleuronectes platessa]|uniref:Uncharacterized protein n=1 Tax=Pleuronectes platessa TaxID=8262 RepID=A0A9N7V0W9_PLEPL|nr:unnamed protein product [Pleuronectes platessa]
MTARPRPPHNRTGGFRKGGEQSQSCGVRHRASLSGPSAIGAGRQRRKEGGGRAEKEAPHGRGQCSDEVEEKEKYKEWGLVPCSRIRLYRAVTDSGGADPRTSLNHPIGSSDEWCVQRAGPQQPVKDCLVLQGSSSGQPPAFPSRPRAGRGANPTEEMLPPGSASARERSREEILPHLHGSLDARVTRSARRQEFVHRQPRPTHTGARWEAPLPLKEGVEIDEVLEDGIFKSSVVLSFPASFPALPSDLLSLLVQHCAQGHFGMQMGQTGDRTADLQVGGRPLYPSVTARDF